MKIYAITRTDGGVSIMSMKDGANIDSEIAKWEAGSGGLRAVFWSEVSPTSVPTDRTFRNAWKYDAALEGVVHDIPKTKQIAHDIRRKKRAAEMAPHDEVIAKQIPGSDPKAAERERVKLRQKYADVQVAIDAASTVEAIKGVIK